MRKYLGFIIVGLIIAFSWFKAFAGINPINCVQAITPGTGVTVTGTNSTSPTVSLSATDSQSQTFTSQVTVSGSSETVTGNLQVNGYIQLPSQTLLQIQAITPTAVGQMYFCSNCATASVCVSTGTTIYGFSTINTRATICN